MITGLSVNLFVSDSEKAFAFYRKVYDARLIDDYFNLPLGEKNCRLKIGEFQFALADENIAWGSQSPLSRGGVSICIQLFLENLDEVLEKAIAAGAKFTAPSSTAQPKFLHPDGFIFANVEDPFGHIWSLTALSK